VEGRFYHRGPGILLKRYYRNNTWQGICTVHAVGATSTIGKIVQTIEFMQTLRVQCMLQAAQACHACDVMRGTGRAPGLDPDDTPGDWQSVAQSMALRGVRYS